MKKFSGIAAIVLSAAITVPALASGDDDCGETDRNTWMTKEAVQSKLTEQGYQVERVKVDDGCFEAYARREEGQKLELRIHPVSGEIIDIEEED
jgi:hypothetical protein